MKVVPTNADKKIENILGDYCSNFDTSYSRGKTWRWRVGLAATSVSMNLNGSGSPRAISVWWFWESPVVKCHVPSGLNGPSKTPGDLLDSPGASSDLLWKECVEWREEELWDRFSHRLREWSGMISLSSADFLIPGFSREIVQKISKAKNPITPILQAEYQARKCSELSEWKAE